MRRLVTSVIVILLVASAISATSASAAPHQTFRGSFSTSVPGAATGADVTIVYQNPMDPNGKPVPVRHTVLALQPGTRIDTSIPASCAATDVQLQAQSDAACPGASRVGGGEIDIATGLPAPGDIVKTDVSLFNAPGQLIFLVKRQGTQMVVAEARAQISGATVTSDVMPTPGGPPDGQSALKLVHLSLNSISTAAGAYIATPSTCPASGAWVNAGTFSYADGVTESVASQSACAAGSSSSRATPPARHSARKRWHGGRHHRARRHRAVAPRFTG